MSRLKLVLLVSIVAVLGIVFVQNREPLALKLLCPDSTQTCLYQTPNLPLAVWMGLFVLGGFISSLLSHILNRYRYGGLVKTRSQSDNLKGERKYDRVDSSTLGDRYQSNSYEVPQEPERVEHSGTNYSYKYRDAKDRVEGADSSRNTADKSVGRSSTTSIDSEINLDKEDEDWI